MAKPFVSGDPESLPYADALAAVDLGFGAKRSCGVAVLRRRQLACDVMSFGRCVGVVADLVNQQQISALVVEAPLSGLFGANGDPVWRSPFERQPSARPNRNYETRYWYVQPGSTVCLAAVAFFQQLVALLGPVDTPVLVFEGFFTFKPKGVSLHCEDARLLALAARSRSRAHYYGVAVIPEQTSLSVLRLSGASSSRTLPAVVVPRAAPPRQ